MAYTKCPLLKKKDGRVTASPNHLEETLTKILRLHQELAGSFLRFAQDDQKNVGHVAVGVARTVRLAERRGLRSLQSQNPPKQKRRRIQRHGDVWYYSCPAGLTKHPYAKRYSGGCRCLTHSVIVPFGHLAIFHFAVRWDSNIGKPIP